MLPCAQVWGGMSQKSVRPAVPAGTGLAQPASLFRSWGVSCDTPQLGPEHSLVLGPPELAWP